uniref:Uncharacterized protein LOC116945536 n=1 Tax=Petromyzon marinus TaxID=7757 RepID=A0AAJ7TDF5_PETMA|nr:uncharacterized protein LOC116945536 [Petromyzon marinus]
MENPDMVECPICGRLFKYWDIQFHSSNCHKFPSPSPCSYDMEWKDRKKESNQGATKCHEDEKEGIPKRVSFDDPEPEDHFGKMERHTGRDEGDKDQAEGGFEPCQPCPVCSEMFLEDIIDLHVNYCLDNDEEAQQHVPRTDVPNCQSSLNQHSQDESMERPEDEADDHSEEKEEQDTKSEDAENKHLEEAASEQVNGQDEDGEGIPCPLCQYRFPEDVLQDHAEMCGEQEDVIFRFINSEPRNCPICDETFPIPQLLQHAVFCDGWRSKEEGKAKSEVDEEEEKINSQRILDRLIQNCADGGEGNTEGAVATTDNSTESSLIKIFTTISNLLGKDSNWINKMEEMWKQCDGSPIKFIDNFMKLNFNKGVSGIGPNSLIFEIIKFVMRKMKNQDERNTVALHCKGLFNTSILPWVASIGGWVSLNSSVLWKSLELCTFKSSTLKTNFFNTAFCV